MTNERKCVVCGKSIEHTHKNTKSCSYWCRLELDSRVHSKREKEKRMKALELNPRYCLECGKPIPVGDTAHRVHPGECKAKRDKRLAKERYAVQIANKEPKLCIICGNPIPKGSKAYRLCSEECKAEKARIKSRECYRRKEQNNDNN